MTEGQEDEYLDNEYKFMGTVVGPVAEATERSLGAEAPDLVYVESSKCGGNVTLSFSEACEIKLSKEMEKTTNRCSNLRSDEIRPCIMNMYPEVAKEEQEAEGELK